MNFVDASADPVAVEGMELFGTANNDATAQLVSFDADAIGSTFDNVMTNVGNNFGGAGTIDPAIALTENGSLRDFLDAEQGDLNLLDGGDGGGFGEGEGEGEGGGFGEEDEGFGDGGFGGGEELF